MRRAQFQFHKGAIKSHAVKMLMSLGYRFQFHKGAIKSLAKYVVKNSEYQSFNSIKVRLKVHA